MSARQKIIDSFTRTLFVQAYASFVEQELEDGADVDDLPYASHGENWMDVAPESPESMIQVGLDALARITSHTGHGVETMFAIATRDCAANGRKCTTSRHTPDEFGYCLAMQYVGHGVGWNDNHATRLDLPYGEFNICSREECGLPERDDD